MTKHGAETAERGRKIKQIEDYRGIAPDEVLHDISDEELQLYTFINEKFAQYALLNHDFTVIHVP
jgi:hypothetical protein